MKTKVFSIALLLFISCSAFGQKVLTVDFDSVKVKISDQSSAYYYPDLIKRFVDGDTTLTSDDYFYIYYGTAFAENYNPYGTSDNEEKFYEFYNERKYKKAIPFGEKVLKENPVNLTMSFKMLVCHHVLGDSAGMKKYVLRHLNLQNVIFNSGDGNSIETAYVVLNVSDEYNLLFSMERKSIRQALVGDTDVLTTIFEDEKSDKNTKDIYFNVRMPLDYLDRSLSGNDE
jgi:hypothetical protein